MSTQLSEPVRAVAPAADRPAAADLPHDAHRRMLVLVAVLTAVVLTLTASIQIYDSNLYIMSEATALLAGDHPYRDFFESGAPLAAYLAAGAQIVADHRLIGEFLRQWMFIVAGVVIAFHLGLRLSRSIPASLVMMVLALLVLAETPTYHYPKLFFFPLTIWLAWRYMDLPGVRRSALLGLTTAVAFLFRHDYGVYLGFASVLALALARAAVPASRHIRSIINDVAAYAMAVAMVVAPWAAVVQMNEGLVEYTRMRAVLYQSPHRPVYASLLELNPLRQLTPVPPPAPRQAVVGFVWNADVDEARRQELERRHGLRLLAERDPNGRFRYEVPNIYDVDLLALDPYILDGVGFEWDRVKEMRSRLPARDNVALWLQQMALVVPLLLLLAAAVEMWRSRRRAGAVPPDAWRMLFAGTFLVLVDSALLRQATYMVTVAPVTAALSARFLAARTVAARSCAIGIVLLTSFAAIVWVRATPLFRPSELGQSVSKTFAQLLASPPTDGHPLFRYLRECTAPGDRLLVTGVTPFHVSYYAQRPVAGGHVSWHHGWRSDPVHQEQSLALLQRQSVPLAVSTHDRVLDDFSRYPKVREYLMTHYVEVEGMQGLLLADTRRVPVRRFGPLALPCFQ